MPNVSKQQWAEWRNHPVSKDLHASVYQAVESMKEQLVVAKEEGSATLIRGMIVAFREVLDWVPKMEEEEVEDAEVSA